MSSIQAVRLFLEHTAGVRMNKLSVLQHQSPDMPPTDLVIMDRYHITQTPLLVRFFNKTNRVNLVYHRDNTLTRYRVQDFEYLIVAPSFGNISKDNIIVIPSEHLIDFKNFHPQDVVWKTNEFGGLTCDRSRQMVEHTINYANYLVYPYTSGIFLYTMLNKF